MQTSRQDMLSLKQEMRDVYNREFEEDNVLDEFDILIETSKAEKVLLNFKDEIVCLLDHERMKEKVYNSLSLGIKVHHNVLKVGDFITQQFKYSPNSMPRNYIVRSLPQINRTHDYSFLQICQYDMHLLNKQGNVISIPVYFEDNRTRLEDRDSSHIVFKNSKYQLFTQDNEVTRQLDDKTKRIMIDGKCYEVTGTDTVVMKGLIYVGLNPSDTNPNTDNFELGVADYYILIEDVEVEEPEENPENPETPDTNEVILGNDIIYYGDENNYKLNNSYTTIVWEISGNGVEIITNENNNCTIRALNTAKYLGEKVILSCVVNNVIHEKEITIHGF